MINFANPVWYWLVFKDKTFKNIISFFSWICSMDLSYLEFGTIHRFVMSTSQDFRLKLKLTLMVIKHHHNLYWYQKETLHRNGLFHKQHIENVSKSHSTDTMCGWVWAQVHVWWQDRTNNRLVLPSGYC